MCITSNHTVHVASQIAQEVSLKSTVDWSSYSQCISQVGCQWALYTMEVRLLLHLHSLSFFAAQRRVRRRVSESFVLTMLIHIRFVSYVATIDLLTAPPVYIIRSSCSKPRISGFIQYSKWYAVEPYARATRCAWYHYLLFFLVL